MVSDEGPYTLSWHPYAEEDLHEIIRFIAEDNPIHAKNFGKAIYTKTLMLKNYPFIGREGEIPSTRELIVHSNYIIIYHIQDNNVQILRVKHAARKFL